jgi:hypothetical protein
VNHICTLRCIGKECAHELDQFLCLVVDKSAFVKEVANVRQRGFLHRKPFNPVSTCLKRPHTKSSERYENLSHAGTHATTKEGYIYMSVMRGDRRKSTYLVRVVTEQPFEGMQYPTELAQTVRFDFSDV